MNKFGPEGVEEGALFLSEQIRGTPNDVFDPTLPVGNYPIEEESQFLSGLLEVVAGIAKTFPPKRRW